MNKPQYDVDHLIGAVVGQLALDGVATVAMEDIDDHQATLAAASLLLALGVEPVIDPDDHSRAAETVRLLLAEDATKTTTRARRQL